MNISEFPVHQNIVNKVVQQQQLKHLQQSSNSFGSRKASMLPNAISSAKSNPIVTVGMSSIIPLVSNKQAPAVVKLTSPLKDNPRELKSGGRYSALNSKIENFKRDGSPQKRHSIKTVAMNAVAGKLALA